MATVYNRSHSNIWVIETDSGSERAHILEPGKKSPAGVDADGFKGINDLIDGWSAWWKCPSSASLPEIFDHVDGLTIHGITCVRVPSDWWNPTYDQSGGWGQPIGGSCLLSSILVDQLKLEDHSQEMTDFRNFRAKAQPTKEWADLLNDYDNFSNLFSKRVALDRDRKFYQELRETEMSSLGKAAAGDAISEVTSQWNELKEKIQSKFSSSVVR